MARDTAVGREHVLIVPSSLTLDGGSPQQSGMAQNDINQQILEVSNTNLSGALVVISSSDFYSYFIRLL